jgi:hypothetical protein
MTLEKLYNLLRTDYDLIVARRKNGRRVTREGYTMAKVHYFVVPKNIEFHHIRGVLKERFNFIVKGHYINKYKWDLRDIGKINGYDKYGKGRKLFLKQIKVIPHAQEINFQI